MNVVNGQLLIHGVVQLIDSTGGGVPVVWHLHRVGPGDEDFDWLEKSEGRYAFEDIFQAWAACPVLLANEQERRRQENRPWEKLQVNALVLDGSGVVRRAPDGHVLSTNSPPKEPEHGAGEDRPAGAVRSGLAAAPGSRGIRQRRPFSPRPSKRLVSAEASRVPAADGAAVYARTAARLGEHEEVTAP